MVVIVADKLMISQCWLKHNASLSCLGCDKDIYERVSVPVCAYACECACRCVLFNIGNIDYDWITWTIITYMYCRKIH